MGWKSDYYYMMKLSKEGNALERSALLTKLHPYVQWGVFAGGKPPRLQRRRNA